MNLVEDVNLTILYLQFTSVYFKYYLYVQTLEMLEKKERFLLKKSSAEVEKAKDYTKAKNKNGKYVFL